ncbi:ornithine cyclodeaminase family protein [Glaciibacter superstes]|uniref:ornithine cyclodeaminase family protein n=1 Tax=Glaciibacter superstes TaxID=501023 RepID=UPI0003B757A6|nr:ornithine cyclodeaminase family protein [Glaciibacter superstes]
MTEALPWISADDVFARVGFGDAIRALQRDLTAGLDPSADFSRSILDVDSGQLLLMPSRSSEFVGVKVATVAPGNPAVGKERIQGVYLLMDAATLSPVALLDGTALTTLRTPAVSAAVADRLAPNEVDQLVVFGSGPQAWGHIEAMRAIRSLGRVSVVGRDKGRAAALAARVQESGLEARVGSAEDVRTAQIIVCATTAREPLFDGSLVPDDSCSIAVGSHEPDARELPSALMARAQIVVEDTAVAMREGGDVLIPIGEGLLDAASLVPMRGIITGTVAVDHSRPRVFTSSGMSWEDLVVAGEVYRNGQSGATP